MARTQILVTKWGGLEQGFRGRLAEGLNQRLGSYVAQARVIVNMQALDWL